MVARIDLIGQRFGKLTVVSRSESKKGKAYWLCRCDCGVEKVVYGYSLNSGNTRSCGCIQRELGKESIKKLHSKLDKHPRFKDLTGQKFNMLTAISWSVHRSGKVEWKCRCDCGKETTVLALNLTRGHTTSCGCHRDAIRGQANKADYETGTSLHRIWLKMKRRCREIDDHAKYYFQRGIKVCDEWEKDYKAFRDWSLSHGYDDSLTIDRIDNNKGYSPENCRWVTMQTQANNNRKNRIIEYNGERKTIAEWSRILNVGYKSLYEKVINNRYVSGFPDGYNLLRPSPMGYAGR